MSVSLLIRSVLALLLGVAMASLALTHAAVPPQSAYQAAVGGGGDSGVATAGGPIYDPRHNLIPRQQLTGVAHPPHAAPRRRPHASPVPPATPPPPTPTPLVIRPAAPIALFPNIPGHIFYDGPDHNLRFLTGRSPARIYTGDGASVAPALSPDGTRLAWVELQRNFSDIYITNLTYGPGGAVIPTTSMTVTQDQSPPPSLQAVAPTPGVYDPRYEWWATKPAWLPDGRRLIYVSDRPGFDPTNPENATGSIWEQGTADPIAAAVRLSAPIPGTGGHDSPSWRPRDPAVFVYVNYTAGGVQTAGAGILEAAMASLPLVAGSAPAVPTIDLTPDDATEYQPVWSPDGRYIAVVEDKRHTRTDLKILRFRRPGYIGDYLRAQTVVHGAPYVAQPFWSPDGRYLGYLVSTGGDFHMVIRRVTRHGDTLQFGAPIAVDQARAVSADYRPTWGP